MEHSPARAQSRVNKFQVKAKPRTPPPVDEAAERERAALGDKISQLQERMRQRKEELSKQKEAEVQAASSGPSLSDLEKQKMEKMRAFIAQARDAKGIAPGQSALSSLGKPGLLSPLGGGAEGLFIFSAHFISARLPSLLLFMSASLCSRFSRWREKAAGTPFLRSSPALAAPFAIDLMSGFISCKLLSSVHLAAAAASISALSARIFSARFI